jgi:quinol monooxygenase YgiN
MSVVRISLARFDPSHYDAIREMLVEAQRSLTPAIKALKGNLAFYAGMDRENNAMQNVSVWESLADAKQLDTLPAMLALIPPFRAAGARFERPVTNHETLWVL